MKLTKDDIGEIINLDGFVKPTRYIELDRLCEVVKELSSRRQGDEHGHAWIMERDIYDLFGEVLEKTEIKDA